MLLSVLTFRSIKQNMKTFYCHNPILQMQESGLLSVIACWGWRMLISPKWWQIRISQYSVTTDIWKHKSERFLITIHFEDGGYLKVSWPCMWWCIRYQHIVAYRPIAKQWLRKQRLFLGNSSINMFPLLGSRFLITQELDYNNGNGVFLCGPCWAVISKEQSQWITSSAWEAVKRGPKSAKLKNLNC
jgi:hypothetical protein